MSRHRHHLLAVWNPAYGQNAMEAHLRVFLQAAREYRAGRCDEDDVYVWWGKVRSPNRRGELPHLAQILAMETEEHPAAPDEETHVYLTDYRSLFVAHLGELRRDDPTSHREERPRVPAYYRKERLECDFWMRLWDIRRLVTDDLPTVIHELRKLRNVRYHDMPVTIYGGMVDLPLIVRETHGLRYFDPARRQEYTQGRFWAEFDSEHSGVGLIERELRENMFGDRVWQEFGPLARQFIATGEKLYRDHASDPLFDFSAVLIEYCKALEVQCGWLLSQALKGAPPEVRCCNVDGKSVDLDTMGPLAIGQLARVLGEDAVRVSWLKAHLANGVWFTGQLPQVLSELADLRNRAAHSEPIDHEVVAQWRRHLCGVGHHGHFVELGRLRVTG